MEITQEMREAVRNEYKKPSKKLINRLQKLDKYEALRQTIVTLCHEEIVTEAELNNIEKRLDAKINDVKAELVVLLSEVHHYYGFYAK